MSSPTTKDIHSPVTADDVTFSRRGLGKRLLLGASAFAVLLAGSKSETAQAAVGDPWKLGGNTIATTGTEFLGTTNAAPLIFRTTNAERMRITPSGNVGIGTTAPGATLQVNSATYAVMGRHIPASGSQPGVYGDTLATVANASGVQGIVRSTTPGVDSAGVLGQNNGTNSNGAGVRGSHAGGGNGVHGTSVYGFGVYGAGYIGVYAQTTSPTGDAVLARADNGSAAYGVNAYSESSYAVHARSGTGTGIRSESTGNGASVNGVYGYAHGTDAIGVRGEANAGPEATGIWGVSSSGWAGYFSGKAHVTGLLSKGGGSFKIDHPLDPENKNLYHSFVESPDMKNVYDGVVTLDDKGEATVEMPDWFEALNRDFRYQLTAVGAPGPNLYIAEEIKSNSFKIAGGKPGTKVSWMVTGIRQDAFANANRIPVEEDKPAAQRGKYLHPKEHGKPESAGVDAERINKAREKSPKHERPSQGAQRNPPPNQ